MPARKVDAAPMVAADTVAQYHFLSKTSGAGEIAHNVPYAVLSAPEAGPQNPFSTNRHVQKNILTGHVEEHVMSDKVFENMQRFVLLVLSLTPFPGLSDVKSIP